MIDIERTLRIRIKSHNLSISVSTWSEEPDEPDSTEQSNTDPSTSQSVRSTQTPPSTDSLMDDALEQKMVDSAEQLLDKRNGNVHASLVRHWLVEDLEHVDSDRANNFIDTHCTTQKDGDSTIVTGVALPSNTTETPPDPNTPPVKNTSFHNLSNFAEENAAQILTSALTLHGSIQPNRAIHWIAHEVSIFDRGDAAAFIDTHCILETHEPSGCDYIVGGVEQ